MKWILIFASLFFSSQLSATGVDRREMVRGAFHQLPAFIAFVEQLPSFKELDADEAKWFARISKLAKMDIPLHFSEERADFQELRPNEPERLMRSTALINVASGEILEHGEVYVNLALLQDPAYELRLLTTLKLAFHEYAHKSGLESGGARDRLAQHFINEIEHHLNIAQIDVETQILTLSLPASKLTRELAEVPMSRPQPTNLVLLKRGGEYLDITENIFSNMGQSTALLRSLWTEMNAFVFDMTKRSNTVIENTMQAKWREMEAELRRKTGRADIDLGALPLPGLDGSELRLFQIGEIHHSEFGEDSYIQLLSTYTIKGTQVGFKAIEGINVQANLKVTIEGMHLRESLPIPVIILIRLPKRTPLHQLRSLQVTVQPRPNVDYTREVRVAGLIRGAGGDIAQLKIKLDGTDKPHSVFLVCEFDSGQLMVRAKELARKNNRWEATFEFPPEFYNHMGRVVATSVVLNEDKTLLLDRVMALKESPEYERSKQKFVLLNSIVADSAGLWGIDGERSVFQNKFARDKPVIIADNVNTKGMVSIPHSRIPLEFKLQRSEKIREVRLHLRRVIMLAETVGHDKQGNLIVGERVMVPMDERLVPMMSGNQEADVVDSQDVLEILSASESALSTTVLPTGEMQVRATFNTTFKTPIPLQSPTHAYVPPAAFPFMIEVVTDRLHTLRHYFVDGSFAENCSWALMSEPASVKSHSKWY